MSKPVSANPSAKGFSSEPLLADAGAGAAAGALPSLLAPLALPACMTNGA
jgi:hypothetical protein